MTDQEDELASVKVTNKNVYFHGLPLPKYIKQGGVSVECLDDGVNLLTVTFIVGTVILEGDDVAHSVDNPIYTELTRRYKQAMEDWSPQLERYRAFVLALIEKSDNGVCPVCSYLWPNECECGVQDRRRIDPEENP